MNYLLDSAETGSIADHHDTCCALSGDDTQVTFFRA